MTQKSWPWSTVAGLGDGAAELNEALSREFLAVYFGVQDPTVEGVSKGVGGELEVTGTGSPLAVASGSGICYGLYINDTAVNTPAIATPAVGTTGGRVVLQTNWAGTGGGSLEARTRVAVRMSADGVGTPPALVQSFGTTWEISLATFTITTGGVITVTDDRTFRRSTMVVGSDEIDNDSVGNAELRNSGALTVIGRASNSTGDPADIAAGANDRILARTGNVLSFVQATIGMIPDALITLAKLANLAGVSLLGRAANSTGVMAAITAAANDTLLRRTGDALNFGQVTAGMLPADVVDDSKVGNRVPRLDARQGNQDDDWWDASTAQQVVGLVRMEVGFISTNIGGSIGITFDVPFSGTPLIFLQPGQSNTAVYPSSVSELGFTLNATDLAGVAAARSNIAWWAVGPE